MGQQLSDEWIDANIFKMSRSNDPQLRATAEILENNKSLIRVKANVPDPNTNIPVSGGAMGGANRWNRINIPEPNPFQAPLDR
jgi:hypothetical protein